MSADVASILALQLDPIRTQATLLERVDGVYRFVARGAALTSTVGESPDVTRGVADAVAQLERAVGRRLSSANRLLAVGAADGAGVDAACLVVDMPQRVAAVGVGVDAPLDAARAAARAAHALVRDEVRLLPGDVHGAFLRLGAIVRARATDVLVLTAAALVDADVDALVDALESGRAADVAGGPVLVAYGPNAFGGLLDRRLGEHFPLVRVASDGDGDHASALREALLGAWRAGLADRIPGYGCLADHLTHLPIPAPLAMARALESLTTLRRAPVWSVDAGEDVATLWRFVEGESPRCAIACASIFDSDTGEVVAEPTPGARRRFGRAGRVARAGGLATANLPASDPSGRPWCTPATGDEADDLAGHLEARLARTGTLSWGPRARRPSSRPAILVATGHLCQKLTSTRLAGALIDGLRPRGVWELRRDSLNLLATVGALAGVEARAAADLLAREALESLGTVVRPFGDVAVGKVAIQASGATGGGRIVSGQVAGGEVVALAVSEGERAEVVGRPSWRANLGRGRLRSLSLVVEGGPLGLILDARPESRTPGATRAWLERAPGATPDETLPPVVLAGPAVPVVDRPALVARTRALPWPGRLMVGAGDIVEAGEVVGEAYQAQEPIFVHVAQALHLGQADITPYLLETPGETVGQGDVLARRRRFFGLWTREVTAPVAGTLVPGSLRTGQLVINPHPRAIALRAHLPGRVVAAVARRSVAIETTGLAIQCAAGLGVEARGPLRVVAGAATDRELAGAVVVVPALDPPTLETLVAAGASGVVTGSITAPVVELWHRLESPPTVVATADVADSPIARDVLEVLVAQAGRPASIGAGRRDGYHRVLPELIIPLRAAGDARPAATPALAAGAHVRAVAGAEAGRRGRVVALPDEPAILPSGLRALAAEVALDDAATATVPRANLEVLA